ncbi:transcription factor LHW-like [Olea europaea var. sylvestris]|uniref:transcription factor LHW-like n=1 Tax=Olea europaea var. sylvestris TaxID=158386 RepID=UPI000C1D228D|nr:transcription factor LHW-like [Olea europaea var. sylvestris]
MGYLFKEALKTLCGVNQWSYAVFWKIGLQNPKLLIWEEYYYEPISCSRLPGIENPEICLEDYDASWASAETRNLQPGVQAGNKVHMLVNKMMMDNYVNVVGEGLIGRAAFTGNHQWILSESFTGEAHPTEVVKEAGQQFSAGMQTIAVVPVLPHGVVQLGSHLAIVENVEFVNDVKNLVHQLGYLPSVLHSENYAAKHDSCNYVENSSQTSCSSVRHQSSGGEFQASNSILSHVKPDDVHNEAKITSSMKLNFTSTNPLVNGGTKAEVIPSCSEISQQASLYIPILRVDQPSSSASTLNSGSLRWPEPKILPDAGMEDYFSCPNVSNGILTSALRTKSGPFSSSNEDSGTTAYMDPSSSGLLNTDSSKIEASISDSVNNLAMNHVLSDSSAVKHQSLDILTNSACEDACVQPLSGDDLFDILGIDFKNKLLNSCSSNGLNNGSDWNEHNSDKNYSLSIKSEDAEIYTNGRGNSDSDISYVTGGDHLLDAIVSGFHSYPKHGLEDNISCKTMLSDTTCSSAPDTSLPYGRVGASDQIKGELVGVPKYLAKAGSVSSCSFVSGLSKNDLGTHSQRSSIHESQIGSWVEKFHDVKQTNSVSTSYSKKCDEISKAKRKRLKPGENPRPRPKDRQMIQDRVKELREIVPNGAKCSIDSLLERTIKHMTFMQSVTKHADKLKQTGESKIISKDDGVLLKDDFKGGATWAYEIGSTSMVCPIIVEDLNQPQQMLVEMLCKEHGLFLEIADVIRGLGLTILKGLMESCNDKIWARFVVETNRDVTRMEIFISLIRLLEQTAKSSDIAPFNDSSNDTMTVHQFQEAASIPATGRSHG